ncbi:MAG: hypothetical protein IJF62_01365 [Firmicutes bacterium]|nr:hypothetical protein [Bacillota bacterium]MBQ6842904.1 hypothetical protein [Bacillota bacterium]
MKKADFVSLILGTVGLLLFSFGMCMGLIAEWGMLKQGIIVGVAGLIVLGVMVVVRRNMLGLPPIHIDGGMVLKLLFGLLGACVFGFGMCLVLVWGKMMQGIIVGIIGMVLLVCLIPMCMGIRI